MQALPASSPDRLDPPEAFPATTLPVTAVPAARSILPSTTMGSASTAWKESPARESALDNADCNRTVTSVPAGIPSKLNPAVGEIPLLSETRSKGSCAMPESHPMPGRASCREHAVCQARPPAATIRDHKQLARVPPSLHERILPVCSVW